MVEDPDKVDVVGLAVLPGPPPHAEQQHDGAAVTRQAALPGHENLPEALPAAEVIVGLVEDAVTQAGAHDGTDQQGVQQRVEQFLAHALTAEEPPEDIPAQDESRDEQQAVPAEFKIPDMQDGRIDVPMYKQHFHYRFNLTNILSGRTLPKPSRRASSPEDISRKSLKASRTTVSPRVAL